MPELSQYKEAFLNICIDTAVLKFGTFELKSGRVSPYFFNAGLFHRADLLRSISRSYAKTIASADVGLQVDVLFGPAYKGIPLAAATTEKLADLDQKRFGGVSYSFNRKEAKDHGEGGNIVGASLKDKNVLIVDDVITAGTAIREAIDIIHREGGTLVGIVVALDRMEKVTPKANGDNGQDDDGNPRPSAIGQVRAQYDVPVLSILTLDDIIEGLSATGSKEDVQRLDEYRRKYRAAES